MSSSFSLRFALASVSSVLAFSLATTAHAAEHDQAPTDAKGEWSERPLALHGLIALPGGPSGLFGLELDYAATDRLGITAGLGVGYVAADTDFVARYALGGRYRFVVNREFAVGAGATLSTGRFASEVRDYERFALDHAVWAGAQLSLEWRFGVFSVKTVSSIELLVNRSHASCSESLYGTPGPNAPPACSDVESSRERVKTVFFAPVGVALGCAF